MRGRRAALGRPQDLNALVQLASSHPGGAVGRRRAGRFHCGTGNRRDPRWRPQGDGEVVLRCARGDEAWRRSAELCGKAAAAQTLRRAAEGGRRQLTGGPQAAATRGGVRGARGLEWAARPAVGPDGEGRKRKGERKGVGPAGLGFGPGQAVLFVCFFPFEIKPRFKFK